MWPCLQPSVASQPGGLTQRGACEEAGSGGGGMCCPCQREPWWQSRMGLIPAVLSVLASGLWCCQATIRSVTSSVAPVHPQPWLSGPPRDSGSHVSFTLYVHCINQPKLLCVVIKNISWISRQREGRGSESQAEGTAWAKAQTPEEHQCILKRVSSP